jgi:hypothetical protein
MSAHSVTIMHSMVGKNAPKDTSNLYHISSTVQETPGLHLLLRINPKVWRIHIKGINSCTYTHRSPPRIILFFQNLDDLSIYGVRNSKKNLKLDLRQVQNIHVIIFFLDCNLYLDGHFSSINHIWIWLVAWFQLPPLEKIVIQSKKFCLKHK